MGVRQSSGCAGFPHSTCRTTGRHKPPSYGWFPPCTRIRRSNVGLDDRYLYILCRPLSDTVSDALRKKLHGYADTIAGVADLCDDIKGGLEFAKELLAELIPREEGTLSAKTPSHISDGELASSKNITPSSPSASAVLDSPSASICGPEPKSESNEPRPGLPSGSPPPSPISRTDSKPA